MNELNVYLCGEIHSNWRVEIEALARERDLPISFFAPVTDHTASDDCGVAILGEEDTLFWKDHKAAKINAIRIRTAIDKSDIVVALFGEKYKQWNTAFEAGYAVAKGKALITVHSEEHRHALKDLDAAALAVADQPGQVIDILEYVSLKK